MTAFFESNTEDPVRPELARVSAAAHKDFQPRPNPPSSFHPYAESNSPVPYAVATPNSRHIVSRIWNRSSYYYGFKMSSSNFRCPSTPNPSARTTGKRLIKIRRRDHHPQANPPTRFWGCPCATNVIEPPSNGRRPPPGDVFRWMPTIPPERWQLNL